MSQKIEAVIPVSLEYLADAGYADDDLLRVLDEMAAASQARWRALPWYRRAVTRVRIRFLEPELRLRHAFRALRGIECEP